MRKKKRHGGRRRVAGARRRAKPAKARGRRRPARARAKPAKGKRRRLKAKPGRVVGLADVTPRGGRSPLPLNPAPPAALVKLEGFLIEKVRAALHGEQWHLRAQKRFGLAVGVSERTLRRYEVLGAALRPDSPVLAKLRELAKAAGVELEPTRAKLKRLAAERAAEVKRRRENGWGYKTRRHG